MRFVKTVYLGDYFFGDKRSEIFEHFNGCQALPMLSIGQMIELIRSKRNRLTIATYYDEWEVTASSGDPISTSIDKELCDALWQVVKKIL